MEVSGLLFSTMHLTAPVLAGLESLSYIRPSPVQARALPLARFGADLVVQAKAGTGKTLVYAVALLERLAPSAAGCQAVVIAPTREIAIQGARLVTDLAAGAPGLGGWVRVAVCVGGLSVDADARDAPRAAVVVGTPGRLSQLVRERGLDLQGARFLALDEADKLMDSALQADVNVVFAAMPERKQVLALSATYSPATKALLAAYMRSPREILIDESTPSLIGVRQCLARSASGSHADRLAVLDAALAAFPFQQCVVFCNGRGRGEAIAEYLVKKGWPAISISSQQSQPSRNQTMDSMRSYQARILVSTDLIARGVDLERVTLVVNMDLPRDLDTYLHRVGRTGRFGTRGVAITIVSNSDRELAFVKEIEAKFATHLEDVENELK